MIWTTAAPAVTTAFLSSLVEAVEALTIVLAVASVRGWRPAALGAWPWIWAARFEIRAFCRDPHPRAQTTRRRNHPARSFRVNPLSRTTVIASDQRAKSCP